ncbi:hypothetical protein R1flu_012158 [Riccia fluitans]|uniref:cGMP-dependent protein kinase n=1 Tax=Riccia fluitans TaxID=41844 RepID=A0ABD1Z9U9_9MARC
MQPETVQKEELEEPINAVASSEGSVVTKLISGETLKDQQLPAGGQGPSRRCSIRRITKMELELIHTEGAFSVLKAVGQCLVEEEEDEISEESSKSLIEGFETKLERMAASQETMKDQNVVAGLLSKMEPECTDTDKPVPVLQTESDENIIADHAETESAQSCKSLINFFETKLEGATVSEKKAKDYDVVVDYVTNIEPGNIDVKKSSLGLKTESEGQGDDGLTRTRILQETTEPGQRSDLLTEGTETKSETSIVIKVDNKEKSKMLQVLNEPEQRDKCLMEDLETKSEFTEEVLQNHNTAIASAQMEQKLNHTEDPVISVLKSQSEGRFDIDVCNKFPEEKTGLEKGSKEYETKLESIEVSDNQILNDQVSLGFIARGELEPKHTQVPTSTVETVSGGGEVDEGKSKGLGETEESGPKCTSLTQLECTAIMKEIIENLDALIKTEPEFVNVEVPVSELKTVTEGQVNEKEGKIPEEPENFGTTVIKASEIKLENVAVSKEGGKDQDAAAKLPEFPHTEEEAASCLKTVSEGQVEEDEAEIQDPKMREPRQRSKSLSTGALEIKAKIPAGRDISPSIERVRKRSHVPLTVLERMQKDPIVAQHFAQLENPTEECISGPSENSKRLLHTTNRLRRTTDSVGLKYVNQYIVIKILGRGTYGKVKLCLNTMDCKLYAVKIVHRKWMAGRFIGGTTEDVGHGAMREIAIMKKLNHPNIVALHEVIDDPTKRKLYLVLEYVEGGPIMGNEKWHPFPEDKARLYFRDMCKGIDYLHFNKVVHRDLKPGNLLQTLNGTVKISDFGVSHMFEQESDSMHDRAGTPAFLAPEVCSGGECHGRPADLWSLGVPLIPFQISPPPPCQGHYNGLVVSREPQLVFSSKIKISRGLKDLLTLIFMKDPSVRISLAGVMQHEWVTRDGLEPLIPYKVQVARGSTTMSVTEAEVKAAVGVNKTGLAALCSVNPEEKVFEEGEYIIRQGEEGNEMYFINSGQCEVLVESRSLAQPSRGRMEYAVAERGPGQYIGEMELQKDDPGRKPPRRNASIRAKTRVVALVLSRDKVMEVLSKNSEAAQSMAETIAERDRELQMKLRALDLRMPSMKLQKEEEPAAPASQPQETCSSCR